MTIKHLVSNVLWGLFRHVAPCFQRVALASAKKTATHRDVLQNQSVAQSAAEKFVSTERVSKRCNTATLLFLKRNITTYVHTYARVYRASIERGFELLRPMGSGSVGALS